jgi:hypothetical protein
VDLQLTVPALPAPPSRQRPGYRFAALTQKPGLHPAFLRFGRKSPIDCNPRHISAAQIAPSPSYRVVIGREPGSPEWRDEMTTIETSAPEATVAKTSWFRRVAMGTAFAAAGFLTLGTVTTPAQAYWYGYYGPGPYYYYHPHYYGWYGSRPAYWGWGYGWRGGWGWRHGYSRHW